MTVWFCVLVLVCAERRYVARCVAESMRLYPHPPVLLRRALAPDTLPGGYQVPARQDVMISVYNIHHSPQVRACVRNHMPRQHALACSDREKLKQSALVAAVVAAPCVGRGAVCYEPTSLPVLSCPVPPPTLMTMHLSLIFVPHRCGRMPRRSSRSASRWTSPTPQSKTPTTGEECVGVSVFVCGCGCVCACCCVQFIDSCPSRIR